MCAVALNTIYYRKEGPYQEDNFILPQRREHALRRRPLVNKVKRQPIMEINKGAITYSESSCTN